MIRTTIAIAALTFSSLTMANPIDNCSDRADFAAAVTELRNLGYTRYETLLSIHNAVGQTNDREAMIYTRMVNAAYVNWHRTPTEVGAWIWADCEGKLK